MNDNLRSVPSAVVTYQAWEPKCWDCDKPCPPNDAYRCFDCKAWFHRNCMARHFGLGIDQQRVDDRLRLVHLEHHIEFLTMRLNAAHEAVDKAREEAAKRDA